MFSAGSTISAIASLDRFSDIVREVLAELRAKSDSQVSLEMLEIQERRLRDEFQIFRSAQEQAMNQEISRETQSLISRGLASTTVLDSFHSKIKNDTYGRIETQERELTRAIEEIALNRRRCIDRCGIFRRLLLVCKGIQIRWRDARRLTMGQEL